MKIQSIHDHFKIADPKIYLVLQKLAIPQIRPNSDAATYFNHLCRNIIGQQLSGRVADVIEARFLNLFSEQKASPEKILLLSDQQLRDVGMSWAKVRSIKDLALKTVQNVVRWQTFNQLDDESVINELIKIKGVGRWTAEMFLIFTLGREDVFSFGDLGLKKGLIKLYQLKSEPSPEEIKKITQPWSPFRSYASLALWRNLDS